ncbi:MAG: SpoIIE family protein phosphatase [Kiritimatiellae bacterium]|nr:SpoIIE family protein phosphatase [Kiritimatiellia bacterium]
MNKRIIVAAALCLYAALLAVVWHVCTFRARAMTEALLDYAVSDIRLTMDGAIDTMLEHVAVTCARRFGRADRHTREEVDSVAHLFDIDELCIVDRAGIVIASNDPDSLGVDMNKKEATQPFAALTNGTTKVVTQPFRSHAYSKSRRKYLGVPFPGGDGYVQVGMDEARMPKMINTQLSFLFDAEMGDTVCYLCADMETGSLVSTYLEGCETPTLEEIGFDASDVSDPNVTFEQTLFGDKAFCRSYVFGGHRFIMVVPSAEFYGTRDVLMVVMTILLALVLGAFVVLLLRISNDARRIKAFYAAEDAARAKDMVIAKTIQTSALPVPLAANPCFRLAASMTPAREVGGDFYDFFMLDQTHLAFLVADVSGKGVTAALYMMTAKTVIKDALLATHDIAAAFTEANRELCRNNSANMFLTAWGGVLDLETGVVAFVNAGHNPPAKVGKSVEWLADKSGTVMAFMDCVKYTPRLAHLAPGDVLFLYTDGVTEAMDRKGELFGEERLAATLAAVSSSSPDTVCGVVRVAVAAFADGAPAVDDLTVLAVQYVRQSERFVRSFPPTQEGICQASAYLDECLKEQPPGAQSSLHIILDEIASNIVKHSGASGFEVDVEFTEDPAGVRLVFVDDGVPYDPLSHADPDTKLPAAERPIGGLGIMMVKKMADSISYERARNRNFLTVFKRSS